MQVTKQMKRGPSSLWGGTQAEPARLTRELKFTIFTESGDGAILSQKKVSQNVEKYFDTHGLNLEDFALDPDYATSNNIPEFVRPFEPGSRAEFGRTTTGITVCNRLILRVYGADLDEVFSADIPSTNIDYEITKLKSLGHKSKSVYVIGCEGLEDCSITGYLPTDADVDITKLRLNFILFDYITVRRQLLSVITYNNQICQWEMDSYEGTGDNYFDFLYPDTHYDSTATGK